MVAHIPGQIFKAGLLLMSRLELHVKHAGEGRNITLPVTILWLAAITWCTQRYPDVAQFGRVALIGSVVYFFGLSIWRTRKGDPPSTGIASH